MSMLDVATREAARGPTRASTARKYRINVHMLTGHLTAVVRGELPVDMLPYWLDGAFGVIYGYVRDNDIATAGAPFARFTSIGDVVAVAAGVPVTTEILGDGHIEPSVLPSGCAAVTTLWGHQDDVGQAYEAVKNWLARQGCVPAGPHWESYYTDPRLEPDPRRWRTDVVVPYRVA